MGKRAKWAITFRDMNFSYFGQLPEAPGDRHKFADYVNDLIIETAFFAEMALTDDTENLVDGWVGG